MKSNGFAPGSVEAAKQAATSSYVSCTCSKAELPGYGPLEGSAEPIFPPFLHRYAIEPLAINGVTSPLAWYRPTTLHDLLDLKAVLGVNGKIVGGNTELGIDTKFRGVKLQSILYVQNVTEMRHLSLRDNEIVVGGAVTLSELRKLCKEEVATLKENQKRVPTVISDMLRWFASSQIRNVASKSYGVCCPKILSFFIF